MKYDFAALGEIILTGENCFITTVSIINLVWIDVESNTGSRFYKHINTQYRKQAKDINLLQIFMFIGPCIILIVE